MILSRGYKFRLYATDEQTRLFGQFAGTCRFVYNIALEQRRDWWKLFKANTGGNINYVSQARELTALRADVDWIAACPVDFQQQALRDLDRAFDNFFKGIAKYPTPRKRGENDSFRFPFARSRWRKLNAKWGMVLVPKVGEVKFRLTREIPGTIKNVTVTRDDLGWHVVFCTETEAADPPVNLRPAVGVDRGVVRTLALSDGTFRDIDRERLNLLDRRARKQARALSRKRRGSSRRNEARRMLARTKATAARLRKHWNHERSREIADAFGTVVVEALNTKGMTAGAKGTAAEPGRNVRRKAGLNQAILNNGWHQFEVLASYKLAANGGRLVKVNPAYTSQTCSECGTVDKTSRENQATFRCVHCGHEGNADTNAARNILRAGTQPAPRIAVGRPLKREPKRAAHAALENPGPSGPGRC